MPLNCQFKNSCGNKVSNITIRSEEKVYLDNRLNFDYHVSQLCKRDEKKLYALTRVFKCMNTSQRKLTVKTFKMSQFSNCSLIWMFHSQGMEYRINRFHERTLKLIYPNQHQITFKELLEKNKTVSIHQRNLQTLATEIYKAKNKISPEVVNSLFEFTNKNYNLRNASILKGRDILQSIMEVKVLYP